MVSLFYPLLLSSILFIIGIISLIVRKNLLFILISLEIMINSVSLALISVSSYWDQIDGQIMYILLITLSASEASISLILLLQFFRNKNTLNLVKLSEIYK
ncbi:NADH-quinone oxidoreductase subunit NuoK [Buchnera aphidicola]|uniref:NADH-quinone oxidoreductase subunit NuoK n=1 Tax=Buchnera aphidicola TaxID=9 RepID=UPI0034642B79